MKSDYLWDKKGGDAEIEKLENALQSFRYQPNSPPILTATNVQVEEQQWFRLFSNFFRFALPGFASLAVAITAIGFWLNESNRRIADVADLSKPIVTPISVENQFDEPVITQITKPIIKPRTDFVSKPIEAKTNQLQKPTRIVYRPARKVKKSKAVTLSDEEQYAYEQLMLALSITSSRLKEVKDKANGGEQKTAKIDSLR